jgi:protein tyrosine phosphatase (PTP) superfamily phosphohydrolase (DUF442 family)
MTPPKLVWLLIYGTLGCARSSGPPAQTLAKDKLAAPVALTSAHLPNPVRIHPKVVSGGLPEGDAAFRELKSLGFKTIISVDGARPDVELARKYGLRYVHLPFGYDGIPDQRVKELAKAVRDFDGPIYIHCHHGKHRSPVAATVACVSSGLISPDAALPVLQLAGTSQHYRGLFQSARSAVRLEQKLLDELKIEFPEIVQLPPLADAMVAIEHTHDHLKQISAAGWHVPADQPDLEPAHEALLLREHFAELLRSDIVQAEPEPFRQLLRNSEYAANQLESALRERPVVDATVPPESLQRNLDRVSFNCTSCHEQFRDVPLSEKH